MTTDIPDMKNRFIKFSLCVRDMENIIILVYLITYFKAELLNLKMALFNMPHEILVFFFIGEGCF